MYAEKGGKQYFGGTMKDKSEWLERVLTDCIEEASKGTYFTNFSKLRPVLLKVFREGEIEARIDELENFSEWINKGLAETHRIKRLTELNKIKEEVNYE